MMEGARGGKRPQGTGSKVTQLEIGGECARVMPESGESSKTKQGVDRAVQIYDVWRVVHSGKS
jgi:hypothetical protein